MHLDQFSGQWVGWLLEVFQKTIHWLHVHNFHQDISQLMKLLDKGLEPATLGLHLITVFLAFASDVLKRLARPLTKCLVWGGAASSAASFAGIQFDVVSQESGAAIFVFSLSLAFFSFTMLVLQHITGEKAENNGALAAFFPAIERLQEKLGIIEGEIDDIKKGTRALLKGQEDEKAAIEEIKMLLIEVRRGGGSSEQALLAIRPKTFSYLAMTVLGAFMTWLIAGSVGALGPTLAALLSLLGGISSLAISLMYGRYYGILGAGAEPETSPERQAYTALRESLARGNLAARLYPEQLTRFLNWIERFFGDAGMADRTLFPHAFGLKKATPLWTALAFDRCLFLALIYPIATIFIIWTVSGHAGPAEMALGLKPDVSGWSRGLIAATAALEGFVTWTLFSGKRPKSIFTDAVVALCAVAGAAALTFAFGSSGAGAVAFGVAVVAAVAMAGRAAGAVAVAAAVPTVFGLAFALAGASMSTVAWAFCIVGTASIGTLLLCAFAIKHQAQGVFLLFFIPAMILACLAAVKVLSHLGITWPYTGPLLLFLGLLTLLNAPFDWASLGLTRALLRRGLELKGWWPYVLALVDACLAGAIVALLALIMVVGVQAFDELAVHGDGEKAAVLPLDALFDGIAKNPAAPEYWWVYALLLSSMIPSLINLIIGGTSLLRGIPGLASVLLHFMPAGKAVPAFERAWMALVLTGQIFAGAFLGIAAQALLAWGLIFHVMPWIGLDLLDMARAVAKFDVPLRAYQLFAGIL